MNRTVLFHYSAPFIGTEESEPGVYDAGVLSTKAAGWFAQILSSIPNLAVDFDLCQEDWGVVIFTKRDEIRFDFNFWSGPKGANTWVAEVEFGDVLGISRFFPGRRKALDRLVLDLHDELKKQPGISNVTWFADSNAAFSLEAPNQPTPQ